MKRPAPDPTAFIRQNLRPGPAPMLPEITLFQPHPGSGLARLGREPYWAYLWAGGAALAHHVAANPEVVRGRSVLDLGAGSGVVGIAAALAGAARVICAETDPYGAAAIALNAALNGVTVEVWAHDLLAGPPPEVDLIAAGDVFYAADLAARMGGWLAVCHAAGIAVLVGDPGRAHLPWALLSELARYPVQDFGRPPGAAPIAGMVFAFCPQPADTGAPSSRATVSTRA